MRFSKILQSSYYHVGNLKSAMKSASVYLSVSLALSFLRAKGQEWSWWLNIYQRTDEFTDEFTGNVERHCLMSEQEKTSFPSGDGTTRIPRNRITDKKTKITFLLVAFQDNKSAKELILQRPIGLQCCLLKEA